MPPCVDPHAFLTVVDATSNASAHIPSSRAGMEREENDGRRHVEPRSSGPHDRQGEKRMGLAVFI